MSRIRREQTAFEMKVPHPGESVKQYRVVSIERELKGMPVMLAPNGRVLGQVADALVHPTAGALIALIVGSTKGSQRLLVPYGVCIRHSPGAVIVRQDTRPGSKSVWPSVDDGVSVCDDLIGAMAVTTSGRLLGRVGQVYLVEESLRTIYRIASSRLQRALGGGFFMAGTLPHAWSKKGSRLIVQADDAKRHLFSSLDETVAATSRWPAFAGDEHERRYETGSVEEW